VFTQGTNIAMTGVKLNNYALTSGTLFNITGTPADITGFANGTIGRYLILINASSGNIKFTQEDAASTATNRLQVSSAGGATVGVNETITFIYCTTTLGDRWVCIATH
jgi:hypothetical protein